MINLPKKLIEHLLNDYLNYDDLIVLSKVCDELNTIVKELIQSKLIWVKKIDESSNFLKLCGVKKVVSDAQSFITHSQLRFRLNDHLHSTITKLICYSPYLIVGLDLINLTHLEIVNTSHHEFEPIDDQSKIIELKLKKLKFLRIDLHLHNLIIRIDAPNLLMFKAKIDLRLIQIVNRKSIKILNCFLFEASIFSYKNLNSLTLREFDYENVKCNLFQRLVYLKEIHLQEIDRASFDKLIQHKREAKSNAKIYLNNFDVSMNGFDFDRINKMTYSLNERDYLIYRSNANQSNDEINIDKFIIDKNLNVPMDFFDKFLNVRCLDVNIHRISVNNWIRLLKSLKLSHVHINVKLEQKYLNLLAKYCGKLKCLSLFHCDDFEFIFCFGYLEKIHLHEFPSFELFKRVLNSFDYLNEISIMAFNYYEFNLSKHLIESECDNRKIFRESRSTFLNYTINCMDSWMDLIGHDAVSEIHKDD